MKYTRAQVNNMKSYLATAYEKIENVVKPKVKDTKDRIYKKYIDIVSFFIMGV